MQPKTIEERLVELDKVLNEYDNSKGINFVGEDDVTKEARLIQNAAPSAVKKWNSVQLGENAYILRQFAFRLQIAINSEQGKQRWANESLWATIGNKIHEYHGYSLEERKSQAIADNDAAKKYEQIRVNASLRIERLSYLSTRVSEMAKSLESLAYNKRGEKSE